MQEVLWLDRSNETDSDGLIDKNENEKESTLKKEVFSSPITLEQKIKIKIK